MTCLACKFTVVQVPQLPFFGMTRLPDLEGDSGLPYIDVSMPALPNMVQVPQPPAKATATRDALARALYGQLFLWIIGRINATMDSDAGTPRRFGCMLIASLINATMDSSPN